MRALIIVLNQTGGNETKQAAGGGSQSVNLFTHYHDLELPALESLGLGEITGISTDSQDSIIGSHGIARASSASTDMTAILWEIAGVISTKPFAVFDQFPEELVASIQKKAGVEFIGNRPQNGVSILDELGDDHLRTGKLILYTDDNHGMEIAAHEKIVSRARLYEVCRIARKLGAPYRIKDIAARPFTGDSGAYAYAAVHAHHYPAIPPRTILNAISESGLHVVGIGDVGSIFARSGITRSHEAKTVEQAIEVIDSLHAPFGDGLALVNLTNVNAAQLLHFDAWLSSFLSRMEPEDLLIITSADGGDVPLLVKYDALTLSLGIRNTFADISATLASFFGLKKAWPVGEPFFAFRHPIRRNR